MPRVTPDANDVVVWLLSETGTTFANTGTAGSAGNLAMVGSTGLVTAAPGPFGNALAAVGSATDKTNLLSTNPCPAGLQPASPISLSGWVKIHKNYSTQATTISPMKGYRTDQANWTAPFNWGIWISSGGALNFTVITGATQRTVAAASGWSIPFSFWSHVGLTYDGATLKGYLNGEQVASSAVSGAVDYGTSGPWYLGGCWSTGNASSETGPAVFADWRLANIARPLSYFQNVWFQGRLNKAVETGLTTYYRLQARDPLCDPPNYARWTDTQVSLANAPTGPCGTPGGSLLDLTVLRKWRQ